MNENVTPKDGFGKKLRAQFMAGIIVVVPVAATVLILVWVFNSIDGILQPGVERVVGHTIPGVGFGVTVVLIYITGVVARNVIGKRLIKYSQSVMNRLHAGGAGGVPPERHAGHRFHHQRDNG